MFLLLFCFVFMDAVVADEAGVGSHRVEAHRWFLGCSNCGCICEEHEGIFVFVSFCLLKIQGLNSFFFYFFFLFIHI